MPGARRASVDACLADGLSFDGCTVLEIKCPISADGQAAAKRGHILPSTMRNCSISSKSQARPRCITGRLMAVLEPDPINSPPRISKTAR